MNKYIEHLDKILNIPLFEDIYKSFNSIDDLIIKFKIELDCYLYIYHKIPINFTFTDDILICFLKFIDFTDIISKVPIVYSHIIKYINENNINLLTKLFDENVKIQNSVLYLLEYSLISNYLNEEKNNDIKDVYIDINFNGLLEGKHELLGKYIIFEFNNIYYNINNHIHVLERNKEVKRYMQDIMYLLMENNKHTYNIVVHLYGNNNINKHDIISYDTYYIIYYICKNNNLELCKFMVSIGLNINYGDELALRVSIINNHIDLIKYLLDNGANLNSLINNIYKYTYNIIAIINIIFINCLRSNEFTLVKSFINYINISILNQELINNIDINNEKAVDFLLLNGADVHYDDNLAIRTSVERGYYFITELLIKNDADIHIFNDEPLTNSCNYKHYDIVKLLLDNGADLHINNDEPLRNSAFNGDHILFDILIEYGADINVKNGYIKRWSKKNEHFSIYNYVKNLIR